MKYEYFSVVDKDSATIATKVKLMIAEDLKEFRGKRVKITLERAKSKRSLEQNALFHMYVGIIAKELGYGGREGAEEMKEIIKFKFLRFEKIAPDGEEVLEYVRPTHLLSKYDFIGFIDSVIRWASGFGIVLPDPSDYGYEPDAVNK